jgi:hypothetical protein
MFKHLLFLVVVAAGVQLQPTFRNGIATEAFIGTPPKRRFMTVDFKKSRMELFAAYPIRSIFWPPMEASSSLRPAGRGNATVDNVTLAGVHFTYVPLDIRTEGDPMVTESAVNSEGVIGLGPRSRFALEKMISISPSFLVGPNKTTIGFQMEMLDEIPRLEPGSHDVAVQVDEDAPGWSTKANVSISGFSVAKSAQIVFDPAKVFVELPNAAIQRLLVILRMSSSLVRLDEHGIIVAPCSANGTISIPFEMRVAFSDSLVLPVLASSRSKPDRLGICQTHFKMSLGHSEEWILNPFAFENTDRVFLDAAERTVVLRWRPEPSVAIRKSLLPAPIIPAFDKHRIEIADDGSTRIAFSPVEAGEVKFQLVSPVARKGKSGSFLFMFTSTKGAPRPHVDVLPGRYVFEGSEPTLRVDRSMSVSLSLRRAPSIRGIKSYRVSVERMLLVMVIILDPSLSRSKTIPIVRNLERLASS